MQKLIINEFWMYVSFFQLKSQVNNFYYIIYLKLFSYDYIRGPILKLFSYDYIRGPILKLFSYDYIRGPIL
jgi:hypothetical protein